MRVHAIALGELIGQNVILSLQAFAKHIIDAQQQSDDETPSEAMAVMQQLGGLLQGKADSMIKDYRRGKLDDNAFKNQLNQLFAATFGVTLGAEQFWHAWNAMLADNYQEPAAEIAERLEKLKQCLALPEDEKLIFISETNSKHIEYILNTILVDMSAKENERGFDFAGFTCHTSYQQKQSKAELVLALEAEFPDAELIYHAGPLQPKNPQNATEVAFRETLSEVPDGKKTPRFEIQIHDFKAALQATPKEAPTAEKTSPIEDKAIQASTAPEPTAPAAPQ